MFMVRDSIVIESTNGGINNFSIEEIYIYVKTRRAVCDRIASSASFSRKIKLLFTLAVDLFLIFVKFFNESPKICTLLDSSEQICQLTGSLFPKKTCFEGRRSFRIATTYIYRNVPTPPKKRAGK